MTAAVVGVLLSIPSYAAAAPTPANPAAGPSDQISSRTNSWGVRVSGWAVNRDGSGWVQSSREGANFFDRVVLTRSWGATEGRFERVEQLLKTAEGFAGKTLPCRLTFTDGPYGDVTWRRNGTSKALAVQYACTSKRAEAIYERLAQARKLAETWGAASPVVEELSSNASGR